MNLKSGGEDWLPRMTFMGPLDDLADELGLQEYLTKVVIAMHFLVLQMKSHEGMDHWLDSLPYQKHRELWVDHAKRLWNECGNKIKTESSGIIVKRWLSHDCPETSRVMGLIHYWECV